MCSHSNVNPNVKSLTHVFEEIPCTFIWAAWHKVHAGKYLIYYLMLPCYKDSSYLALLPSRTFDTFDAELGTYQHSFFKAVTIHLSAPTSALPAEHFSFVCTHPLVASLAHIRRFIGSDHSAISRYFVAEAYP